MQPLRKAAGLKADVLDTSALAPDEARDSFGFARAFAFLDDYRTLVHDADARAVERHINTDKELHGRPPFLSPTRRRARDYPNEGQACPISASQPPERGLY